MFHGSFISIALGFLMMAQQMDNPLPFQPGADINFANQVELDDVQDSDEVELKIFDSLNDAESSDFIFEVLPTLQSLIVADDQIKLRLYFIPDELNSVQMRAAEVLKCSSDQSIFWQMLNKIHENKTSLSDRLFLNLTKELGADVNLLQDCLANQTYRPLVDEDIVTAKQYQIKFFPSIIINHHQLIGYQPIENIKKLIDELKIEIKNRLMNQSVVTE